MHIHFLGIAGSGASAVAEIARAQGFEVSGCDAALDGHSPEHIKGIDILAVTPAVFSQDPDNSELAEAKKQEIKIMTWQEFMGEFLEKDKFVIAVTGTHGKSTTTAMIAQLLEDANLDPTVELGATVPEWKTNYRLGKSKYFITEADEFNNNFLATHADIAVVTNIEMDHPEFFKDFEDYKQSFLEFLYQVQGVIIANFADTGVVEVMEVFQKNKDKPNYPKIIDYSKSSVQFDLKVPGEYNKQNAAAVYQAGLQLDIDPNIIRNSLMSYGGIGRRFELIGVFKDAQIYSDFGHHPTEIKVTIEAARKRFADKRLVVIFQPHMFTRTKALFDDFVRVFQNLDADQIFITDIYKSREQDTGEVNSKMLVEAIKRPKVSFVPFDELEKFIKLAIRKDDVVFFVGAGDIDEVARKFVETA